MAILGSSVRSPKFGVAHVKVAVKVQKVIHFASVHVPVTVMAVTELKG
jgi:hypothetical protein